MASIIFPEGSRAPYPRYPKKQLLNHIVDGMARARPHALYAEFPKSATTYDAGFYKITYAALANAVNGVAWLLDRELGPGKAHETLTYIGPRDFRHNVMILGAVKAGYKASEVFEKSWSIPAYTNLFRITDCKLIAAAEPLPPVVDEILAVHPLRVIRVPSVQELLTAKYPHYPFEKTFEEARDEPLVVMHTSGTTSLPKPIVYTHDFAACYNRITQLNPPAGYKSSEKNFQANRLFVMMSPFHAANLFTTLISAIPNQTVIILPLSGVEASAQVLVDGLKHTRADIAMLTPTMVEEIARNPALLDFVSRNLDTIFYGGGTVSKEAGDVLMNKVKFFNANGSTELGIYPTLEEEGSWCLHDWKYIIPHPAAGLEFRHQSDNTYEAFVRRNSDPELVQPIFKIYPELHEYPVHDLFSPHPFKPGLWEYRGRADNMIISLTGRKTNPTTMEENVANHSEVREVLMIGTRRPHTGLLIEPMINDRLRSRAEAMQLVDRLWPVVQETNQLYPTDSRITKSSILFTDPGKPMHRTEKGTVQRRATLESYAKEVDALYATAYE
ncbi:hypothetical protein MMC07_001643 [Pseudocyphellaria aurata]|nr:hypothetical protein [Pseudocyphellaria aurata]